MNTGQIEVSQFLFGVEGAAWLKQVRVSNHRRLAVAMFGARREFKG